MKKNKTFSNIIFVLLFYIGVIAVVYATNNLVVDSNELLLIKKNGIIAGMCYVMEIMTGKFAKAIMSIFIMASGWSFITAGKIEWKALLNITIATALLFGGSSISHLISRNDYSCKSFKYILERQDGVIENVGFCLIREIPEYQTSQVWTKCNKDGGYCEQRINMDVDIIEDDIVNLSMCEEKAYKVDEQAELKYKCTKRVDNTYHFVKFKGEKFCVKYCDVDNLRSFFNTNDNYRPIDKDGVILAIGSKPYMISGTIIKNNTGYLSGTILDIDCKEGANELTENGEVITEATKKPRGVKLKCDENLYKIIDGKCERSCNINTLSSYKNVLSWLNCPSIDSNENDCSTFLSSNTTKQIKATSTIKINECSPDYNIQNPAEKASFKCGDGLWTKIDSENGENNTFCEKGCNKNNIPNFDLINSIVLAEKGQEIDISNRNIFYENEFLLLKTCIDKARYLTKENREATSKTLIPAQFSCKINGSWENVNYGEYCYKDCFLDSSLDELNINFWEILTPNKNSYTSNETKNINISSLLTNRTIFNKEYFRATTCNTTYGIKNEAIMPIFSCKNGILTRESGIAKPCKKICQLSTIPQEYKNVALWNYCNESVNSCSTNFTDTTIVFEGDFISTKLCKEGYEFPDSNRMSSILECTSNGNWTVKRTGDNCRSPDEMKTCDILPAIPTITNGVISYYLSTDSTKTNLTSTSKTQPNAIIVSKLSCNNGYIAKPTNIDKQYTCQLGNYTETQVGSLECEVIIPFHITVKTTSSNQNFTFKFNINANNGSTQDCTIDWGDGTTDPCPSSYDSTKDHTYSTAKDYELKVSGRTFVGIYNLNNVVSASMITKLHSYGRWGNNIIDASNSFYRTGLNYINPDAFKYLPNVTNFLDSFHTNTSLTSIPADLFKYNTKVTIFTCTFCENPSLTTIPVDLFRYNTMATSFYATFRNSTSLTSIPVDLFRYNTAATNFMQVFSGCSSLKCSDIDGGASETVVNHSTWLKWGPTRGADMTNAKFSCKL